jgi:linoleoyl-CoA desaturase
MDVLLQNKSDTLIKTTQCFSWTEIKKHNRQNDCWIVIDQFVYDITPWIKEHPGGNVFTILAGEDATAMFYSNHFKASKNLLQKFLIGTIEEYKPLFNSYEDKFFITLKNRVDSYFKENNIDYRKTNKNSRQIIFSGLLLLVSWLCMYLLLPLGMWAILAAIPMGLATSSLIGSFGHEQIHGNLFPRLVHRRGYWLANDILWGLFIPFMPERYFQYEHIRHHNYPMHPEHDYDVYALKDVVRLSQAIPKRAHHNFQHIYAPFTYGVYIFLQLLGGYTTTFFDNREILRDKGNLRDIILSSIVALSFHILLPIYLTNIWWVLLCAGLYFFTWQSAIYISSGLPHMTETKPKENKQNSWSFHVCNTTKNLRGGDWFFNWVTGGLNYHIEHHLIPSIPQEHLHLISPIVKKTCEEFNYPYTNYTSFKKYYADHYDFLKSLGINDKEIIHKNKTA